MQSTPSKTQVQQQGSKEKKSNYWPFLYGMIGCGTIQVIIVVIVLVFLAVLPFAVRHYMDRGRIDGFNEKSRTGAAQDVARNAICHHDTRNRPLV